MLKKLVKENKDRAVEKNGACRFCGQIKLVEALEEFNEDELNELATEQCNCYEAQNYISRLYRKEKADFRIEELFGLGNKPELTDARMQMLHQAAGSGHRACKSGSRLRKNRLPAEKGNRLADMLGARLIHIDTSKEECLERLEYSEDGRDKKEWSKYIEDWWLQFEGGF